MEELKSVLCRVTINSIWRLKVGVAGIVLSRCCSVSLANNFDSVHIYVWTTGIQVEETNILVVLRKNLAPFKVIMFS